MEKTVVKMERKEKRAVLNRVKGCAAILLELVFWEYQCIFVLPSSSSSSSHLYAFYKNPKQTSFFEFFVFFWSLFDPPS